MKGFGLEAAVGAGTRRGFREELCGIPGDAETGPREKLGSQEGKWLDLKHQTNSVTEPGRKEIQGASDLSEKQTRQ